MNSQAQNTFTPGITEEYITQFAEEIERRVTKKLSQELNRAESRNLGASSKLDDFLLNPQVRTCSMAVPGRPWNNNSENPEPTGDRSLKDPYPEVEISACRHSNLTDSDPEEISHMVTGVQGKIPYCSLGTYSRKQKKVSSTVEPQFRSKNTLVTIEADQFCWPFSSWPPTGTPPTSTKFINRILRPPKPLTATMPTFDWNSENINSKRI